MSRYVWQFSTKLGFNSTDSSNGKEEDLPHEANYTQRGKIRTKEKCYLSIKQNGFP